MSDLWLHALEYWMEITNMLFQLQVCLGTQLENLSISAMDENTCNVQENVDPNKCAAK